MLCSGVLNPIDVGDTKKLVDRRCVHLVKDRNIVLNSTRVAFSHTSSILVSLLHTVKPVLNLVFRGVPISELDDTVPSVSRMNEKRV